MGGEEVVMVRVALLALALAACTDKEEQESDPPELDTEPKDTDTADPCPGGTAPVITELLIENGGLQEYEAGEFYPTIKITASEVTDEDWDLETYYFDVWWDDAVDGAVAMGSDTLQVAGTVSDDGPCTASEATVSMVVFLRGGGVEYDTLYEWGGVVTDSNGIASEMAIASGCTPTEDAADGCQ